jgi:predicted DNA-binding transcriptional regulator AlpA
MQPQLISIKQFCADHGISRSFFYKLLQQGQGPRVTKLGTRSLVSAEAATAWRARMECGAEAAG